MVILEERKTLRTTLWMLKKSGGEATMVEVDVDDDDDEADTAGEGGVGLLLCLPWLMVMTGYTATSNGGRCILNTP
jgi:hypothetical protein